jgi:hypothetical protein
MSISLVFVQASHPPCKGDSKVADTVQNAIAQVARSRLEDLVTSFFYQRKLWQRSSYSRVRVQLHNVTEWKLSAVFLFR